MWLSLKFLVGSIILWVLFMVKGLGIDPGTMSFDIAVVENDRVVWEKSISTIEVAKNPSVLVKGVEEAGKVDVIAGPSGYGTPAVSYTHLTLPTN